MNRISNLLERGTSIVAKAEWPFSRLIIKIMRRRYADFGHIVVLRVNLTLLLIQQITQSGRKHAVADIEAHESLSFDLAIISELEQHAAFEHVARLVFG